MPTSSDSDSSEDEDEKRRLKELMSCVVTGDEVQKAESERVEARQTRQARKAAAGTTCAGDATNEPVQTGFEKHTTGRLNELLARTFEQTLQPDVWTSLLATPVNKAAQLQLFYSSAVTFGHVHPLSDDAARAAAAGAAEAPLHRGGAHETDAEKAKRKAERKTGKKENWDRGLEKGGDAKEKKQKKEKRRRDGEK